MRFAKVISYIFHPVFITIYMLAFSLFQKNSYLYYTITPNGRWFFLLVTAILTVIAPVFSIGYMIYSKQVTSIELKSRKERLVPMFITGAYTIGLYYLFSKIQLPTTIMAIVAVSIVGIAITLLITFFWKISAHMMSVAGFGGMLLALSQTMHPVNSLIIAGVFVLMGLVAWARLRLEAHSLSQIIAGWGVGYTAAYFTMIYLVSA